MTTKNHEKVQSGQGLAVIISKSESVELTSKLHIAVKSEEWAARSLVQANNDWISDKATESKIAFQQQKRLNKQPTVTFQSSLSSSLKDNFFLRKMVDERNPSAPLPTQKPVAPASPAPTNAWTQKRSFRVAVQQAQNTAPPAAAPVAPATRPTDAPKPAIQFGTAGQEPPSSPLKPATPISYANAAVKKDGYAYSFHDQLTRQSLDDGRDGEKLQAPPAVQPQAPIQFGTIKHPAPQKPVPNNDGSDVVRWFLIL
jgi:hypothetical protein